MVRGIGISVGLLLLVSACGGGTSAPSPTAAATVAATATATPKPLTVTIGQVGGLSDAAIYLADGKGYFKEQGITLQSLAFTTAAQMVAPLARGDLMVGGGAAGAGIFNAIRTGTAMRIVADKGNLNPGFGYEGLVIRPSLADQIKSAKDLKGRTIALAARDITPEVTLNTYLQTGGLTVKDVNVVMLPHAQMGQGLQTGAIDAGAPIEPYLTQILESGVGKLLIRSDQVTPGEQTAVIFFSEQFAKDRDAAVRFMVAYLKGARFYNDAFVKKDAAKRAEAVDLLAKATKFEPALIEKMTPPGLDPNGRVNVPSLEDVQKYMIAKGSMPAAIDMKQVVDMSFVEEAVKILGTYR